MKIYNLTFIVEPRMEEAVIEWLRSRVAALKPEGCSLLKVVDVPGDPDFAAHAVSISLQKKCADEAGLVAFSEGPAENLAEEYARMAGGEGLTFSTVLEEVSLD